MDSCCQKLSSTITYNEMDKDQNYRMNNDECDKHEGNDYDDDDDNNNNIDFLDHFLSLSTNTSKDSADDDEDEQSNNECSNKMNTTTTAYTSKKPTWWKRKAAYISKSQKRALNDPIVQKYILIRPSYGEKYNLKQIFNINNTNNNNNNYEIWIEIGYGLGDNLLCLSSSMNTSLENNNKFYIGAEVHTAGTATILQRIKKALEQGYYWNEYTLYNNYINNKESNTNDYLSSSHSNNNQSTTDDSVENSSSSSNNNNNTSSSSLYDNVRIFPGDGTKLLSYIDNNTIHGILITFPDPFPNSCDIHWRILQLSILQELSRILIIGGKLYLATDHIGYYEWCHEQVLLFNKQQQKQQQNISSSSNKNVILFNVVIPTPDRSLWLPVISKYEQKAKYEGRTIVYTTCWETTITTTSAGDI